MSRPLLITTSIIVHVPDSNPEDDDFQFGEPFGDRLRTIVEDAFRGERLVEYPAVVSTTAIYLPDANAGRCARCGKWVSDNRSPDQFEALMVGRLNNGQWTCTECLYWTSQDGGVVESADN